MSLRLALLATLAAVVFGAVSAPDGYARTYNKRCGTRWLHVNDRGACVKAASFLLKGNAPMRRSLRALKYFHVRRIYLTKHYGRTMARNTIRMKYRLGYTKNEINGVWGPNVYAYVTGKKLRPIDMRIRAGKRYQRFLHPQPRAPPAGAHIAKMISLARATISYNYANGNRYYYTQGGNRTNFYNGITNWPEGGDCSASILGLEHLSGVPATGGTYSGYTGTIANGRVVWRRGWSLSLLHPGDLMLYGSPTRHYDHVTMILDRALHIYSFGSTTCPCNMSTPFYRFDAAIAVRPST